MSTSENPFASPSLESTVGASERFEQRTREIVPAPKGRRFANYVLDSICMRILQEGCAFGLGVAVGALAQLMQDDTIFEYINAFVMIAFYLSVGFFYYFVQEAMFGRTLGKLATGTKVIDENGSSPTVKQAALRTLCRFIPFEPFSFLGADAPRGWHDRLPKTYVVKIHS